MLADNKSYVKNETFFLKSLRHIIQFPLANRMLDDGVDFKCL